LTNVESFERSKIMDWVEETRLVLEERGRGLVLMRKWYSLGSDEGSMGRSTKWRRRPNAKEILLRWIGH
jgi:hypothetical protein